MKAGHRISSEREFLGARRCSRRPPWVARLESEKASPARHSQSSVQAGPAGPSGSQRSEPLGFRRKLAVILAADAAGYSRLMADDDAATLRSLNAARTLFRAHIEARGGRLIDTAGDSLLAEFESVLEAVDCASHIQNELGKRNSQLAEHRKMNFRIGISLGDVIEQEDGTLYGDGVNIAARVQQLTQPRGTDKPKESYCTRRTRSNTKEIRKNLGQPRLTNWVRVMLP